MVDGARITAVLAAFTAEHVLFVSQERASDLRQPRSPGGVQFSPSQPLSPPGTPVTAAAAMASAAAAQKPVSSAPLTVGSHPLAGPFSPSKPAPLGSRDEAASPGVSADGAPGACEPWAEQGAQ